MSAVVETLTPADEQQVENPGGMLPRQRTSASHEPFPVDCLPVAVRTAVEALASTLGMPVDLPAVVALGALNAAIGDAVWIQTRPGRELPSNLYFWVSAPTGTGKSETYRWLFQPLVDYDFQRRQEWNSTEGSKIGARLAYIEKELKRLNQAKLSEEEFEAKFQELAEKKSQLIGQNHPPRILYENVTSEALAIRLNSNGGTGSVVTPDGRELVDIITGKYNKRTDENLFLKGYSREAYLADRVSRESIAIESVCLTMLILIQPGKLEELASLPTIMDSGLLQRCLIAAPQVPLNLVDRNITNRFAGAVQEGWKNLIKSLLHQFKTPGRELLLTPCKDAEVVIDDYENECIKLRRHGSEAAGGFICRRAENVYRLAATLHCAQYSGDSIPLTVGCETMAGAVNIVRWFSGFQDKIFGGLRSEYENLVAEVISLLRLAPDVSLKTELYRRRIVPDAGAAESLLTQMVADRHLLKTSEPHPGGGHAKIRYAPTSPDSKHSEE